MISDSLLLTFWVQFLGNILILSQIVSLNCEELVTRYHKKIELKFLLVHYTGYAITFCNYNVLVSELTKAINDTMLSISDALNKIRYL